MALNNFYFLLFFGIVLVFYWMIGAVGKGKSWLSKARVCHLPFCSYVFIYISDFKYLLCVLAITLTSYIIPIAYERKIWGISKGWICTGIIFNLIFLGFFKYYGFFYEQIARLLGGDSVAIKIMLPLGVSIHGHFGQLAY